MNNTQLEIQFTASQKEIQMLRQEVDELKSSLDKAFRSSGLATEWAQSKPSRPFVEITSQKEVASAPTTAVLNAAELRELTRAFFPDVRVPTIDQLKKLIETE